MAEAKYSGYLGTYHMIGKDEFEPQRTNNFEVYIDLSVGGSVLSESWSDAAYTGNALGSGTELASNALMLSVSSFTPPSVQINPLEVKRGNNTVKYAGVPSFPDSSITFNDYIGINVEKILMAWQKQTYDIKNQAVGRASVYKKTGWLNEYSPDGSIVRQWNLIGVWLSSVNLGEFSSDNNSVRQVTGTLIYDYAYPEPENKGVKELSIPSNQWNFNQK